MKLAALKSPSACLAVVLGLLLTPVAWAQAAVSINIAPPPLLAYVQPPVPGDGYIWTPGYWSWSALDADYYWVPGTWVLAPNEGDLWTPGYWAFENAGYFWHIGYWGSRVGFYGGVNYGYGYSGTGYQGGRWNHGAFQYNRALSNVNTRIVHNVYGTSTVGQQSLNRVSFNGGVNGLTARPTGSQRQLQSAEHAGPSADQVAHETAARALPTQRAHGPPDVPQVAATPRPSEFAAPGVENVRSAPAARPTRPAAPRAPMAEPPRPAQRVPADRAPEQHAPEQRPQPPHQEAPTRDER
jgi:hypothetical protein